MVRKHKLIRAGDEPALTDDNEAGKGDAWLSL